MTLRPYQQEAATAGVKHLLSGDKPKLLALPTGSGKSHVIAAICKELSAHGQVLVLQPKLEILNQNYQKFTAIGGQAVKCSASARAKDVGSCTYGTLGTVVNMLSMFSPKFIIVDECHLYPYKKASRYGKESQFTTLLRAYPKATVLGLTATPFRLKSKIDDGGNYNPQIESLLDSNASIFSASCHVTQIRDMLGKYWTPLEYVTEKFDRAKLRLNTTGLDFDTKSLKLDLFDRIAYHLSKGYKKAIVFVSSVEVAEKTAKRISGAEVVSSQDVQKERERKLEMFAAGEIKYLINVDILTTGYDAPDLDCIIIARPTMSLAVFYQMIGRVVRLHPDKQKATVIDLAGNVARFGKVEELEIAENGQIFNSAKKLSDVFLQDTPPLSGKFVDIKLHDGKHKGKTLTEIYKIDPNYLIWYRNTSLQQFVVKHILLLFREQSQKQLFQNEGSI